MTISPDPSSDLLRLPDGCFWPNDNDFWIRHIIENGAVRATFPRLKASYVERKLDPAEGKPWEAEISGRLLSLATDIREKAEDAVQMSGKVGIRFRHVCYVSVMSVNLQVGCSVIWEPKTNDNAHANIVVHQVPLAPILHAEATPKISHEFIKSLCDIIRVTDENNMNTLEYIRNTSHTPSITSTL